MKQTLELQNRIKTNSFHLRHELERFNSQIQFAEKLLKLYPAKQKNFAALIKDAVAVVEGLADLGSYKQLKKAVRDAERIMSPISGIAKKYSCYCIGHGHMDMNWMWNWPETVAATNDMFITVDKLMDEFPEFCFSQSQASVYEIIREHNPALFARIKKRVQEGRWEITASEWVEGDKNLVSGESLAHHLLYTRKYMQEHFSLKPEDIQIAWNPDTFGHAESIPMIMNAGGVKYYYMCRGGENKLPPLFWWESSDGSRLLVNLEHTWYNDSIGPHNVRGMLSFCKETGLKDWMLVYGVGDHGGGPTRRDLSMCMEMDSWPIFPNFKFSTTREYFKKIEKHGDQFPTKKGELNFEFTGCYSSQSDIKKTNRLGELNMQRAQTAAVLAWKIADHDYPSDKIRQAWINTLFGHFHDILPGSGIKATREYHAGQFQQSMAISGMIQTNSLRAVSQKIDTTFGEESPSESSPFFAGRRLGSGSGLASFNGDISTASHDDSDVHIFTIFNPVAFQREEVIILSVWDTQIGEIEKKKFAVCYPDGRELPAQRIDTGESWGHHFVKLAVPVKVDALGYYSLKIIPVGGYESTPHNTWGYAYNEELKPEGVETVTNFASERPLSGYAKGDYGMENSRIRVRFDKSNANIIELTDKSSNTSVITENNPAELLKYVLERNGEMSSWLIHPSKQESSLECESFKLKSSGPYLSTYEAKYRIHDSKMSVIFTLAAGSDRLTVDIKLNWLEHGNNSKGVPGLRLRLPVKSDHALYETPFGTIQRNALPEQEVPSLRFVNLDNILLVNDCKYGFEFNGDRLQCTLIRSTYEPDPIPEHGEYEMKFGIIPHGKLITQTDCIKAGIAFNNNLQIVSTDKHCGDLPPVSGALIDSDKENVIISAIKRSEDDNSVIVRLQETAGQETEVKIEFDPYVFADITQAVEVNLLEKEQGENSVNKTANGFIVKILPNSISSVKVKFGQA